MAGQRKQDPEELPKPRRRPATTPEARENQMVALAVDLAEKQLREGTASAQVITHYLKLGTPREQLERQKLAAENAVLEQRAEQIASQARVEELYKRALDSMRSYAGLDPLDDPNDDY